ncbi:(2Fe-2S)-binding protein [Fulvivirga sp. 29W222]|uniref:(2Fe-2S)-binding protein n=1 Tax=Fulvivirga marina TaxID=2494733 RepID=A0A937FY14_9BACT|nr:2Fe-2S iron-sulfur cluster-binding protein [Fulvivirga marina]MBL6446541.1 (2Fe-2S)-binding protein [Fulvivirga marina]
MPKIVVKNLDNKIISSNEMSVSILKMLQDNFIDWMHACGGKGRCTTCKAIILEGEENLSPLTVHEKRFAEMNALKANERLTCQCIIEKGEIIIKVPETSKLPHMKYSD